MERVGWADGFVIGLFELILQSLVECVCGVRVCMYVCGGDTASMRRDRDRGADGRKAKGKGGKSVVVVVTRRETKSVEQCPSWKKECDNFPH